MTAIKATRIGISIDKPLYERIRKEARRQDRKIRSVTNVVIAKGLEAVEREQKQERPAAGKS